MCVGPSFICCSSFTHTILLPPKVTAVIDNNMSQLDSSVYTQIFIPSEGSSTQQRSSTSNR